MRDSWAALASCIMGAVGPPEEEGGDLVRRIGGSGAPARFKSAEHKILEIFYYYFFL